MELDKLFETLEGLREKASVKAAFGEPETVGEKTIIPIARVGYGFGMGFGEGKAPAEEGEEEAPSGAGAGGGGGVLARPIAVLEVTPETTKLIPVLDWTKIALAAACVAAWNAFWISRALARVLGPKKVG